MQKLNRAHIFIFFLLFVTCGTMLIYAQDSSGTIAKLRAVADIVLKNTSFELMDQKESIRYKVAEEAPDSARLVLTSRFNDWRYWNGVLNIAMLRLGKILKDSIYSRFAAKNIEFCFDNYRYFEKHYKGEDKWGYPLGQFFRMEDLDDCGAIGASVIEIYRSERQERYRRYIELVRNQMLSKQARLADRTFARSFPSRWTVWADDLYMGVSFLSRMGKCMSDTVCINDAIDQVIKFHKYLFDDQKGLMHHCWYSDLNKTGVAFWGRANGWAILAQIDLLERLPENHPGRSALLELFKKHILGIIRYQNPDGMWHQLLDKSDSYPETSCSAMFTYAVARSVNKGFLDSSFSSIARKGWQGIMTEISKDGEISGVCTGTIVSEDLNYYYNRPAPLNDIHGIGVVLLAGGEVLNLPN